MDQQDQTLTLNQNSLDQLFSLLIKLSYDSTLNGLLLEKYFMGKRDEEQLEMFRQAAAKQIEKRFMKENIKDSSLKIERLEEEINKNKQIMESQMEIIAKYKENEQKYKQVVNKSQELNQSLKRQSEQMALWIQELMADLETNYSRFKNNETLIKEFIHKNPPPQGIRLPNNP